MVGLTELLTLVSTAAVVTGVVIRIRELRHFSKVREADVIRAIAERYTNTDLVKNFFIVARTEYKTYDENIGKPEEIALFQHLGLLEELGLMVRRGVVPLALADDYWRGAIRFVMDQG